MNLKLKLNVVIFVLFFSLSFNACSIQATKNPNQTEKSVATNSSNLSNSAKTSGTEIKSAGDSENETASNKMPADKSACLSAKIKGKKLIASQTFVFDYEPFPKSCFVTFASESDMLDAKDLPRGSTFYIYRNNEMIYEFADAFDGQTGCWVEAVGFEDLNGDGKIEVIIAGKCLGAKDSFQMNALYTNVRDDFQIAQDGNRTLDQFNSVKQISAYVKKNKGNFF